MLKIRDLKVKAGNKEILKGVNLDFDLGKNYLILGKNGSGKSSLVNFLMGNPNYEYLSGKLKVESGKEELDLLGLSPNERSKAGLFLSFQNVPEIEGINLGEYLRIIYNIHLKNRNPLAKDISPFIFKRFVQKYLEELDIKEEFLTRDLNFSFSGGEKRKIELLQAKLIEPSYIILDEIDSGLDLDAFKVVAKILQTMSTRDNSLIIITHQFRILEYIDVDKVYVMKDGKITEEGGKELIERIGKKGFE